MQPIKDTVKNIPKDPGVYFFKNNKNDIIYIGKAKNIRNRVRTYFQKNKYQSPKNISMLKRIVDVEWIVVDDYDIQHEGTMQAVDEFYN